MGLPFAEVSVAVPVIGNGPDAALLVGAFNSSRLFAFCERVLFSTPCTYGRCKVSTSSHAPLQVTVRGQPALRAEMGAGPKEAARVAEREGDSGWAGPIFLLAGGRRGRPGRMFFARLRGHSFVYPYLPDRDRVTIRPPRATGVLQDLVGSAFVGREWAVRPDATHARSKTYARPGPAPGSRG